MFAGLSIHCIDILAIPEVLIGGANVTLATLITPACADAQVFFCPQAEHAATRSREMPSLPASDKPLPVHRSPLLQIAKMAITGCT
jgi:hypothetical protein